MLAGNQRQHHVERGGAAGAGEAVTVDLEQTAGGFDFRKGLGEAGQILPVDGAFVAVEQAGFGQNMRAGAHRADAGALARHLAEPRQQPLVGVALHVEAGADHDRGAFRH